MTKHDVIVILMWYVRSNISESKQHKSDDHDSKLQDLLIPPAKRSCHRYHRKGAEEVKYT